MNGTNESLPVLDKLAGELKELTPEARKAATYVLENPQDVGVSTIREIADAAKVKPNTVVRMARQIGFEGYDDFRTPFREAIRKGTVSFPDRVRWLQAMGARDQMGGLYAEMVERTLTNIEKSFDNISAHTLRCAAEAIRGSREVFTLGVGVQHANAQNFTYLASTGLKRFTMIPRSGSTPTDDLAWADDRDILIAITCKPYRREVVEAVRVAHEQGVRVIGISDSAASPIVIDADHGFVVAVETPQFFPSSVAVIALLETLLSFVIAVGSDHIPARVERFHARRQKLGMYER